MAGLTKEAIADSQQAEVDACEGLEDGVILKIVHQGQILKVQGLTPIGTVHRKPGRLAEKNKN